MQLVTYTKTENRLNAFDPSDALLECTYAIKNAAIVYGVDVDDAQALRVARLVVASWSKRISADEIEMACVLAVDGKLDIDEKDLQLYGRPLNYAFITRIIRAYIVYRDKQAAKHVPALPVAQKRVKPDYWKRVVIALYEDANTVFIPQFAYSVLNDSGLIIAPLSLLRKLHYRAVQNMKRQTANDFQLLATACRDIYRERDLIASITGGVNVKNELKRLLIHSTLSRLRAEGMCVDELAKMIKLNT